MLVPITLIVVGLLYYRTFVKNDFLIIDTSNLDEVSDEVSTEPEQ